MMQRSEHHQITITRYRDPDGYPTCAKDFTTGEVCVFYGSYSFGCRETCWFADQTARKWQPLNRRKRGQGSLIPHDKCPVWERLREQAKKEESK